MTFRTRTIVANLAWVALTVVSAGVGVWVGSDVLPADIGRASEVTLSGETTGVWRLAVLKNGSIPLLEDSPPATTAKSDYTGELTADQQKSVDDAWQTSCVVWAGYGAFGLDQLTACAVGQTHPKVGMPGPIHGSSADLAYALAFVDDTFEIVADLRVAATGTVATAVETDSSEAVTYNSDVLVIGGVEEKAAAAVAADVDLLIVPEGNLGEFQRQPALKDSQVTVVGVKTTFDAVKAICERTHTQVCNRRVTTG